MNFLGEHGVKKLHCKGIYYSVIVYFVLCIEGI